MSRFLPEASFTGPLHFRTVVEYFRKATEQFQRGGALVIAGLLLGLLPMVCSAQSQDASIASWEITSADEPITTPTGSSSADSDAEVGRQAGVVDAENEVLGTEMTASPDPVSPGEQVVYEITVVNQSSETASNVDVRSVLPAYTDAKEENVGGDCNGADNPFACNAGETIKWDVGDVPAGESVTVSYVAQVRTGEEAPPEGSELNTDATVSSEQDTVSTSAGVVVDSSPSLALSQSKSGDPVSPGGELTYTLTYSNPGEEDLSGVSLEAEVPSGASFVSATGGGSLEGGQVQWDLGTLQSKEGGRQTFTVEASSELAEGTLLTSGSEVAGGSHSARGRSVAGVRDGSPVALSMTASPDPVSPGEQVVYEITVVNQSSETASNVDVRSVLPAYTDAKEENVGGDCNGADNPFACNAGETIKWDVGDVPAGESVTVSYVAQVRTGEEVGEEAPPEGAIIGGSATANNGFSNFSNISGASASADVIYSPQSGNDSPPVATTFSYPVGSKVNLPERITPETNDLYPDNPEADPERESSDVGPYWRNTQDVGNYYSALGGLHAGEDWNWGSGRSDRGRAVYATANGQVLENDRIVSEGGPDAGGYAIIIEHEVPSGETYYSLYLHVVDLSSTDGEIEAPSVSGTVEKGEPIARVGDVEAFSSHLDFQIRDTNWDPSGPLYPNSNPNGYYSHDGGIHKSGMTAQQVDNAFSLMRQDGILDASDFIDNRSEAPTGLAATPGEGGDGSVDLSWDPSGSPDGYNVYRWTSSFSDLSKADKINDSPIEGTSYTDEGVDNTTTYYYRVTAVSGGTESDPSGQASVSLQKLQLLGLEVNQSVQTWKNDVPLVKGKKTIVRVHLQNKREGKTPVNVSLMGWRNGNLLEAPTRLNENYEAPPSPGEDSVETIRKRRAEMEGSLNFRIPESWTQKPSVTLSLVGDGIDCKKTPSMDDSCETKIYFQSTPTPKIKFFIVSWDDGTGNTHFPDPTQFNVSSVVQRVKSIYPVSNVEFDVAEEAISIPCLFGVCGPPSPERVNNALKNKWTNDLEGGDIKDSHIYFGFVNNVEGEAEGQAKHIPTDVAFSTTNEGSVPLITSHELGHVFGLQHAVNTDSTNGKGALLGWCGAGAAPAGRGYPAPDDFSSYVSSRIDIPNSENWTGFTGITPQTQNIYDEVWGVNTATERAIGTSMDRNDGANAELMSYCFERGHEKTGILWSSDITYTSLREGINDRFDTGGEPALASAASQAGASASASSASSMQEEDYLLVKGRIDLEKDSLSFRSFSTITTSPDRAEAIAPESGDYTLQALDESGNVVEEVSFELSIGVSKTISNIGTFMVPIPADPAIEEVQVLGGGEGNSLSGKSGTGASANSVVLGSKSASPNPPTVTVQYPNRGEDLSGDEVTLRWTADDPDGDSLSFTVKYSRNGGSTWKALATSWPRDSLTVDTGVLGGTSNGLIRVQASDGFNTAQDESDGTFGTSNAPPSASIFSPSDGTVIGQAGTVSFDGSGSDTEDGTLSGFALKWQTASGDSLGAGETIDVPAANFPLGQHTIELVATDSVGASDTASVSLQVALSSDPSLLASASALVESDSLVDFGSTGTNIVFDSTTGAATVTTELYDSAPIGADGIPQSNVSEYRILIAAGNGLSVGPGTEVRFKADTLGGIGDPTKVQIYRRPAPGNGPFEALDTQVDSMSTPDDSSDDVIFAAVSGFGEFVLASDSEPLPVELSGFNATVDGRDAVRLTWTTASETGNAGFRVQRKVGERDAGTWSTVGSVEGAGTTAEPERYRYVDEDLPYEADRLTYRLKQVDTDGSASYSKEVTVERDVKEVQLLGTYPNPATSRATLRYAVPKRQDVTIHLYDILGRRVQTVVDGEREGRHERQLDVSRLASGVYFLRLRAEGATKTQKLTVVR